jgi:periplasmic protein CpxP/Spy
MKKMIQSLALAGAMVAAGGSAFAQMDTGMMAQDGMPPVDSTKMAQMHAKHLVDLKAKLQITPSQEPAWTAFTNAMKPSANMMDKRPDPAELSKLPTPERIDKMRALHKERMVAMEAAMDKHGNAIKAFYATLTPEQQKTFDAEHTRMAVHLPMKHPSGAAQPAPKQ